MHTLRIAHRGASGIAPENTLAAFSKALKIGVDLIETDLHATSDGHLALLHDSTVQRTTNGTGRVDELTLSHLRELDAGSWFGPQYAGEKLPLLEEALELARGKALFLVEVKGENLESSLIDLIHRMDMLEGAVAQSFNDDVVRKLRQSEPRLACGLLVSSLSAEENPIHTLAQRVLACGATVAGLSGDIVTPEVVSGLKSRGISVWTWTLNEEAHIQKAISYGVDGIISDFPDRIPR